MKRFIFILALLVMAFPAAADDYEAYDIAVANGANWIAIRPCQHIAISSPTAGLYVRFHGAIRGSGGAIVGWKDTPAYVDSSTTGATWTYPANADSTDIIYDQSILPWNIWNNTPVDYMHINNTSGGSVTIRVKTKD